MRVAGRSGTFAGTMADNSGQSDALTLIKVGTGVQVLTSNNACTGGTTINAGTLVVANTAGSAVGAGPVNILSGGSLGGGSIAGQVVVRSGGTLDPGFSLAVAWMAIGNNLTLKAGVTFGVELRGIQADSGYSQIQLASGLAWAEICGCPPSTASAWRSGKCSFSLRTPTTRA